MEQKSTVTVAFLHREDCGCESTFVLEALGCGAPRLGWACGVTRAQAQEIIREDLYSWANWVVEKRLLNMYQAVRPEDRLDQVYEFVVPEPCPLDPQNSRWPFTNKLRGQR